MAYLGDKRGENDRRQTDLGPLAANGERRWRNDRRHTFVDEIELSESDWQALFSGFRMSLAAPG